MFRMSGRLVEAGYQHRNKVIELMQIVRHGTDDGLHESLVVRNGEGVGPVKYGMTRLQYANREDRSVTWTI